MLKISTKTSLDIDKVLVAFIIWQNVSIYNRFLLISV
ncbi:hypothetical protein CLU96_1464 [Chryseobacterium sp. 52]|nr:hypothetical protein CLU96_1464 [Chryseobacterium sp. 52]